MTWRPETIINVGENTGSNLLGTGFGNDWTCHHREAKATSGITSNLKFSAQQRKTTELEGSP